MRREALWVGIVMLAACGPQEPQPEPEPTTNRVSGALTSTEVHEHPIRVVVAWWTGHSRGISAPQVVVTQPIAYSGSFPMKYTFELDGPPPAEVLEQWTQTDGTTGRQADGELLAYEDRNGNGQLDTIPVDGVPVDRIVARSFEDDPDRDPDWTIRAGWFNLLYNENDTTGRVPDGYGLYSAAAPVPLSTPVKLRLMSDDRYVRLLCQELVWGYSGPRSSVGPCAP
jgi:hypothetical protein